jgi:lipoyl synthase
MAELSADIVWKMSEKELLQLLNSEKLVSLPREIRFYAPSFTYYTTSQFCGSSKDFPTISVTGNGCSLNCKHCGGKVLETMHPAVTPEKLFTLCTQLKREGASGALISGGCLPNGSVPLQEFMPVLGRVKKELGLTVFVHSGILDEQTACNLKDSGVDAVLIDIIGSDETIKKIYNLETTVKHYEDSLKALSKAGMDFIPHVITGLHDGKLRGELNALKMIAAHKPSAIVVISFMPIHGTVMAKTVPPSPLEICRVTSVARKIFPKTPLVLGCMRPKGKHRSETDVLALKAGVNGIAFPSENAIKYAETKRYRIAFSSFCCAQIHRDMITRMP